MKTRGVKKKYDMHGVGMVHGVGYVGVVTVWVLWVDDGYGIGDERKMVWKRRKKKVSRCGGAVMKLREANYRWQVWRMGW